MPACSSGILRFAWKRSVGLSECSSGETRLRRRPDLDTSLCGIVDGCRDEQSESRFGAGVDLQLMDVDREGDVSDGLRRRQSERCPQMFNP